MNYLVKKEGELLYQGDVHSMIETLMRLIELKLGFTPLLQENKDDSELEIYIHSDSYELLSPEQIEILDNVGITENNCIETICNWLNISIIPLPEEEGKQVIKLWDHRLIMDTLIV